MRKAKVLRGYPEPFRGKCCFCKKIAKVRTVKHREGRERKCRIIDICYRCISDSPSIPNIMYVEGGEPVVKIEGLLKDVLERLYLIEQMLGKSKETEAGVSKEPIKKSKKSKKSGGKSNGLVQKLVTLLDKKSRRISELAKMLEVDEHSVRMLIGRARVQGHKIVNVAPKIFGIGVKSEAKKVKERVKKSAKKGVK